MMKRTLLLFPLLIAGCASPAKSPPGPPAAESPEQLLIEGYELLGGGYRQKALNAFDEAIGLCDRQYKAEGERVYASRGMVETMYYMALATAAGEDAITVGPVCAHALYLRGFASLDSGQLETAEAYLRRAIAMSPVNAMYLSELGHIYHVRRDWQRALELFLEAEEYADVYTPDELKDQELARAKRGVGYSLIELGRLDEAAAKFKECLALNPDDKGALSELEYIQRLRSGETFDAE